MLSLLTQHGYQLVRLNPNSKPAELLDHQERVRQVELAESNREKSIAKKVKSCYSDRAVKLKSRHDLQMKWSNKERTLSKILGSI
jgi:hypothetical protein